MSARLEKFKTVSRIKVDPALAEGWDFDARSNGDKNIKSQITQAKRTATALRKTIAKFANIRPEHETAIKAAANAMDAFVKELTALIPWAKAYKVFCEAEYERERLQDLETIAQARWGKDAAALQFEADLIQELSTLDGRASFAQWVHSIGEHSEVDLKKISPCVDHIRDGKTLRERMAATVEESKRSKDNKWVTVQGFTVICSWRIHELYLAHRKEIASKTAGILKGFAA